MDREGGKVKRDHNEKIESETGRQGEITIEWQEMKKQSENQKVLSHQFLCSSACPSIILLVFSQLSNNFALPLTFGLVQMFYAEYLSKCN